MEIKTFDTSYLSETKHVLKEIFFRENSDARFNEWEFAETILGLDSYLPELCLIALEDGKVIGYNALTIATIGKMKGLALGPLSVKAEYQKKGIGSRLVEESIRRARLMDYSWIALLGGDYYARFGFEKAPAFHITVSDDERMNQHLQILFLNENKDIPSGRLIYCDAFYDTQGRLI